MDRTSVCGTDDTGSIPVESTLEESPNGRAPLSKSGGRKPIQVQILSPPLGSYSSMDRAKVSGTLDEGSIPPRSTYDKF